MAKAGKQSTTNTTPRRQPRVDRFRQGGGKLDPVGDVLTFGYVGQQKAADAESSSTALEVPPTDPRLARLKIVSIEQIRPGRYQSRLVIDPAKDEQLRKQIQADLEAHETLQHVFVVVVDPDDDQFYNPKMGGHRRLKIAKELGVQEVFIWVEDYDQEELARGTYFENNRGARQDLTIVEEGELFRRVQESLGWTQTQIAERFYVEGGQPHVSRCIQAASYPEDLQQMLFHDPDRGMRVAGILFALEVLGPEEAKKARAPLIAAFLSENPKERLSTDAIQIAVDRLLGKAPTEESTTALHERVALPSVGHLRRLERVTGVGKSFERFKKEVGDEPLTEEERTKLLALQEDIQTLLTRS